MCALVTGVQTCALPICLDVDEPHAPVRRVPKGTLAEGGAERPEGLHGGHGVMLLAWPNPPLRGPPLRGVHLRATGVALPFALRPCGVVNTSRGRPSSRTPHRSRTSIPPRPARSPGPRSPRPRSEEHTSELQ